MNLQMAVYGAVVWSFASGWGTQHAESAALSAAKHATGECPSGVQALFDLDAISSSPFPSDRFTVADQSQNTGRRVGLPVPDCGQRPSDCADLVVINALDGFNLQPRLSIPFDGPINVDTVTSDALFLISLGSTTDEEDDPPGTVIGIDQVVWDVGSTTLHAEAKELLAQHTRYALIVTNAIRDVDGNPVQASHAFRRFRHTVRGEYKHALLAAIHAAHQVGVPHKNIVTASVFSTQSATAVLEKIRDQIKAGSPEPADFLLGPGGTRMLFPLSDVTRITHRQQTRVEPPAFTPVDLNLALLRALPGAVGQLAFGKYSSPDYVVHPGEYIPEVGTRTGAPAIRGTNEIFFNLVLPSGPRPADGWPVAIYGSTGGGNKNGQMTIVAGRMAQEGIATILINTMGHGFGPLSTLEVTSQGVLTTLLAGGRGSDQNGDLVIGNTEGMSATAPWQVLGNRDGFRQTAADLMQLVRVIELGIDVDGNAVSDLDPSRIYYFGQSQGGNFGTLLLAVEPAIGVGVPNVPGGPVIDNDRLSPARRSGVGARLAARVPSLLNAPGITGFGGLPVLSPHFHDNMPLRDGMEVPVSLADGTSHVLASPVVNTVTGAMEIQTFLDNSEWVFQSGSSVAYGRHLRRNPLAGVPAKSVIIQFGRGDQTNPNPVTAAILRAGGLADVATLYRHDLAFVENPSLGTNPHNFLISTNAAFRDISAGALSQIAVFFGSDGELIIHPEPARFFEVPIVLPLPEDLNFIP